MTAALAREFDRCAPWLQAALARGRDADRPLEEIRGEVLAGRAQLWPGERAVLLTQVLKTDVGLCIHVWLGGGALDELVALRPGVEAWARAMGCDTASIDGRPGWARLFQQHGWAPVAGELRKGLS
jgi:hypothetical protein